MLFINFVFVIISYYLSDYNLMVASSNPSVIYYTNVWTDDIYFIARQSFWNPYNSSYYYMHVDEILLKVTLKLKQLPYIGNFSRGANFRWFRDLSEIAKNRHSEK